MREVTILKSQLIDTLKTNKAKHEELFKEANKAFYETLVEKLTDWEGKVARHEMSFYDLHVELGKLKRDQPEDHSVQYQEALDMLAYEVGSTVKLETHEFLQLVQDEWAWKGQFNAAYTNTTGKFIG